jgi:hypothetical protein
LPHALGQMETLLIHYSDMLVNGHTYRFPNWEENDRVTIVTAKQSSSGKVWLLYEHVGDDLDLRYWVMPDGGIAPAKERELGGMPLLSVLAPLASVFQLEDMTDTMDPALRREIEEILRRLDEGGEGV